MTSTLTLKNSWKSFGGTVYKYVHQSACTGTPMTFSAFVPPQAGKAPTPALYFLSGLTCNEDNFIQKAGAIRSAAARGVALICPDTSPRGAGVPGEDDGWDFGTGAGFYVNATAEPWAANYNMYSYITEELPKVVESNLPVTSDKSIFGHSMGGHGALTIFLKNPGMYASVSAFSPICNPINCPWGIKAFTGYLGDADKEAWKAYDATELVKAPGASGGADGILIDQGEEDEFLTKGQLLPENFVAAASANGVSVNLRMQSGYDHSYWFISTFIDDHINHHADALLSKTE